MNRTDFIKLANTYIAEIEQEHSAENAFAGIGIVYSREASPLMIYAEHQLNDALAVDDETDIVGMLLDIANDGSTYLNDREIYSPDEIWDFYAP